MKNMGLENLVLVKPKEFPHAEATARAAGADDLLGRARVVQSLEEGIGDCHFVIGTSARHRSVPWPLSDPRQSVENMQPILALGQRVAIVFGNEQSGLSNEELSSCHAHLHIPCNEHFSSLNVAAAVQIVCYELRMMWEKLSQSEPRSEPTEEQKVTVKEMESFYTHLETYLTEIGYLNLGNPGKLMLRLRRLFNRALVEHNEIHILRGIFAGGSDGGRSNINTIRAQESLKPHQNMIATSSIDQYIKEKPAPQTLEKD
jgi:TrmH family RNA methyltransferase